MKRKKIIASLAALTMISPSAIANVDYTVQKGDSYWNISQRFNISLNSILSANNTNGSESLSIGEKITVPSDTYTVQKGDTYYLIAKKCNISLSKLLQINNATENSTLYPGQKLKLYEAESEYRTHTVQKGDTYWLISKKYSVSLNSLLLLNNAKEGDILNIGDIIKIPKAGSDDSAVPTPPSSGSGSDENISGIPYITYITHTVKTGDTLWNIAIEHGIPYNELLSVNSLSESSKIYTGMALTIPVHHIPVKYAPKGYGELLEWFTEAQYVIPINADFTITDLQTGKSFKARRTVGSGHADCEPLTANDTAIMKEIWGGTFNWNKRSVLVKYNGRTIAASAAGMMHAGNDGAQGGVWTSWRSDDYGAGINYDYIKGNNAHGHFDLHFYKSIGHSSGAENKTHQANVLKSAGQ